MEVKLGDVLEVRWSNHTEKFIVLSSQDNSSFFLQ